MQPDYFLVGAGEGVDLAVLVEFVVVVVEVEFETCDALLFEVDMFEVEFEVAFDGAVVVVDDELVTVVDVAFEFIALVFERLVFVLLAVSPPQAAPRAAKPRSAESAIAFFMLKTISCLYSKIDLRSSARRRFCPKTLSIFEANEMIGI